MSRSRALLVAGLLLVPSGSWLGTTARVVVGGGMGLLAGTGVTAGVIVARARFGNHYLESVRDMLSWQGLGVPLGAVAGGAAGAAPTGVLAGSAVGMVLGAATGAAAGAAVAAVVSDERPDLWAGGTMGGALGVVLGFVLGWVAGRRRGPEERGERGDGGESAASAARWRPRSAAGVAVLVVALVVAAAFATGSEIGDDVELVPYQPVPEEVAPVEDVVILMGDAGQARYRRYPILPRATEEVEAWAERIGRDSAVTVVMLGDVVYPDGMHPPGSPGFPLDSARVADQVAVVGSAGGMAAAARMYFVAGNHDWGLKEDREGARRLRNLGAFLDRMRARGPNVDLLPPAGSGVPHVVDVGERLRLILLDTAWWLFDAEPLGKEAFVRGVADAMRTAGGRQVVLAAHHPYESAGPHGGLFPVWQTLGLRRLLYKSGVLLQDLESRPYRAMRRELGEVFRELGRPLVFAGGHEHSLQVIAHDSVATPRYSIVSGSASKLTGVGLIEGTVYQISAPGYVELLVRENGAVDVNVQAAPERFLSCPEDETAEMAWERCMAEGQAAFQTVFSARLAGPEEGAEAPAGPQSEAGGGGPRQP